MAEMDAHSAGDALGMIEIQRGVIRRRDFTPLGKLEKIMLGEGAASSAC